MAGRSPASRGPPPPQPDLILNWSAKTQLYGSPAAVLAGMRERVVWWQQLIPSGGWLDRGATLLPASRRLLLAAAAADAQAGCCLRAATFVDPCPASPPGAGRRRAPLDLPSDVPVVGLVGRLQPLEGTGPAASRPRRCCASAARRGPRVIVGGDSYGLARIRGVAAATGRAAGADGRRDHDRTGARRGPVYRADGHSRQRFGP